MQTNNLISTPFFKSDSLRTVEMSSLLFERWRKYIYDNCGIYYQDNKKYLLESRLLKRINFLGINTYDDYFNFIQGQNGSAEIKFLYDAITINETYFFRNQPQLDALVGTIIPEIIKSKENTIRPKIRIWSAASSTGEEAYSISISILDLLGAKYPNVEFEIVGTDISTNVIETAKKGVYKEYSIRNTPVYYLKKYFTSLGSSYTVDPKVKKLVSFKLLNLYDNAAMRMMTNFDIIFCANVLIYFDTKSKIKVVSHLYNSLNRNGYLFIGYSETLHNISKAFKIVSFPKTVGYKKE